jgi:hypothetical protein
VREELASPRPEDCESAAVAEDREPQPATPELLRHVAAIDESQLEQTLGAAAPNGERARVESTHDPASDVEDDDDSEAQPDTNVTYAERPRRQEHEGRVVSWARLPRRHRADVEDSLPARCDADPLRAESKPRRGVGQWPDAGLPPQRAREPGPRDVDEQRSASRVPDGDRGGRRALERDAQRTRAEPDAAAGRGTRDGCRGRAENQCCECEPHLPITVKVSVAV